MTQFASLLQISRLDEVALDKFGFDILQMMEVAGKGFAEVLKKEEKIPGKKILIICGSGHNGGDGLCAARYFSNLGATVDVILASEKLKEATYHQAKILRKMGIIPKKFDGRLSKADLIVDALFGYNQTGEAKPPYDEIIDKLNRSGMLIYAFDNPSGLDIESGKATRFTIRAKATVTLAVIKKGLTVRLAQKYVGKLFLVDLGIPKIAYSEVGLKYPNF